MKNLILLATLPLAAQIDMRMEFRMTSPAPQVLTSTRFVFQDDVIRTELGPSFILSNVGEGKIFIANAAAKTYVEATQAEMDQLIKRDPKAAAGAIGYTATKLEAPAPPPIDWNGQKLQGKSCRYKVDLPNAGMGGFEQTVTIHGTPLAGEFAKLHEAQRKIGIESPLSTNDQLTAVMKECFATDLFPVRTEIKMVMPQARMDTVMVMEITSVKQGAVDPDLLRIPDGWTRDTSTSLREAFAGLMRGAAPPPARPAEPEVTKEKLLASIEELKRAVESGKWEEASTHTYGIGSALMRKAEKERPSLAKQLEDLEAKIASANGSYKALLTANAAEMALKAGRLDKVRAHAQAVVDEPQRRPGMIDDELHRAHTLLGLLALKRGDKGAALSHLDSAGKAGPGRMADIYGPRTELAELLAATGEKTKVANYLDLVSANLRDENKRNMYQTAAKNLRAGQPAYFSSDRHDKYEFPK